MDVIVNKREDVTIMFGLHVLQIALGFDLEIVVFFSHFGSLSTSRGRHLSFVIALPLEK